MKLSIVLFLFYLLPGCVSAAKYRDAQDELTICRGALQTERLSLEAVRRESEPKAEPLESFDLKWEIPERGKAILTPTVVAQ